MSYTIPTPMELIQARLKQFGTNSARALSRIMGNSVGKDVINRILKGDINCRLNAYVQIAQRLGIDEETITACLAWHRLSY
jgi:antitoxin component HigA of HigAB toxin-antitoxin module